MAHDSLESLSQNKSPNMKINSESDQKFRNNHSVSKRLQKELMLLMTNPEQGISAFPEEENLFKWIATVSGPIDTVYEGITFKLSLEFLKDYPFTAPVVKFLTPCFHPNVDFNGNICLDILKEKWSALYEIRTVLLSVQSLLGEPNNSSPLNATAANLWKKQSDFRKQLHKFMSNSQREDLTKKH